MAILEPVRNMWGLIAKATEGAESLLEVADSRGMTGVLRSLLGVDPEGVKKQVDGALGSGIIELILAGDRAGVETTMKFRTYIMNFLVEFKELADILFQFNAPELAEKEHAIQLMKEFMAAKGPAYSHDRRNRAKEAEIRQLRKTLDDIAALVKADGSTAEAGGGQG
jgi:hypothetical protein